MKNKTVGILACIDLVVTLIWVTQMIGVSARYGSLETIDAAIAYARQSHWFFFTGVYVNALVLTLIGMLFYGALYGMLRQVHPEWAAAGLVFVPVYGLLAIGSYLTQIVVVPGLITQLSDPQNQPVALAFLRHLVQAWPHSTIVQFDQFSYFILSIPGLIYGLLLWKIRPLRVPAVLFVTGSALCLLVGVGIVMGLPALVGAPSMAAGVLSLFALGWLAVSLLSSPR